MSTTISGDVLKVTDRAFLFQPTGTTRELWIPLSMVEDGLEAIEEGAEEIDLEVKSWFARREDLE